MAPSVAGNNVIGVLGGDQKSARARKWGAKQWGDELGAGRRQTPLICVRPSQRLAPPPPLPTPIRCRSAVAAAAGVVLAACLLPQVWRLYRTRSAFDLSYVYFVLFALGGCEGPRSAEGFPLQRHVRADPTAPACLLQASL